MKFNVMLNAIIEADSEEEAERIARAYGAFVIEEVK